MSGTFIVRVTVPDGYAENNDVALIEEAIQLALAELNGDTLSPKFDGDDYNAAVVDHLTEVRAYLADS
jgi:hypothetical protein